MCKRSENKLYNVVLLKVCIYAFIIKKDKALLVENVELKVEFPSFCSGLKLHQICRLQTASTGPKHGVRELNNGKFCCIIFGEYSNYTLCTLKNIKFFVRG